ncbi:rhamnan synthesis F family protein [Roseomonas sp. OT10]|uniref:rhamnan synthesis F family protein n=1 Tax=Roseomonas cutis TaxID=2897332 RepID=UPI001E3C2D91|nr:rhamnan synthesis F family protein [Roseomonas sp. OT10]UFN48705.1 rhamnan synthesis F family protein [Roseomonas sp. OT10]
MIDTPADVKASIAVFVHAHYPDIWREMSKVLARRLTLPFHLVVTTSAPVEEIVLPQTPALLSARVLPVENRGRDILPFLRALEVLPDFTFGLKLHTKKSPQREDGAQWRAALLDSLLPGQGGGRAIIERLRADRRIGFVTPAAFCLSVKPWILVNAEGMDRVLTTLGGEMTEDDLEDAYFAAGSMFWFRHEALAGLVDERVTALFEAEAGQLDGTTAHAMERLFPVVARRRGYVSLAMPALLASRPTMTLPELQALARRHADVPSTYFPAPYVPALPPRRSPLRGLLSRAGGRHLRAIGHRILRPWAHR